MTDLGSLGARAFVLVAVIAAMSGCLFPPPDVVRVVDGQEIEGRFVRPDAYSLFMEGMLAEQHGQLAAAERLYLAAFRRDPEGVAILVRLAAVRCAWGPAGWQPAQDTFDDALELDPEFAPIYAERSRCALRRGLAREAVDDARAAMAHAPDDVDVSVLLSRALEAAGDGEQAARVLDGLSLIRSSNSVRSASLALARRRNDKLRIGRLAPEPVAAIDRALSENDLDLARDLANRQGMDFGQLAVRAAALGSFGIARQQARLVLAAEPGHPDATAAWLAAPGPSYAQEGVDPAVWRRLLRSGSSSRSLSALGALVFADALQRRFGRDIAAAWWREGRWDVDPEDPIAQSLLQRLALPGEARSDRAR